MSRLLRAVVFFLAWLPAFGAARAEELRLLVASNFKTTADRLIEAFERPKDLKVVLITGSTGKLATQIASGAPYDVFLAADERHVDQLITQGRAEASTRLNYAEGRLVLWTKTPGAALDLKRELDPKRLGRRFIAIANPDAAPFGAAAVAVLRHFGLWPGKRSQIVTGENIGQAVQFVHTGNAALGFAALSQMVDLERSASFKGRYVEIPQGLHEPIVQSAIASPTGAKRPLVKAVLEYLGSKTAREIIERAGYRSPPEKLLRAGHD